MEIQEVYLGIGGNIGNTVAIFDQAISLIGKIPKLYDLRTSQYYLTTPVSTIPQNLYANAAACFKTSLGARQLLENLQKIESSLGKVPKHKEAPRIIDLDILFFGNAYHDEYDLKIPHPHWMERLFVLVPLSDLTSMVYFPDKSGNIQQVNLLKFIENFPNQHQETVTLLDRKKIYATS